MPSSVLAGFLLLASAAPALAGPLGLLRAQLAGADATLVTVSVSTNSETPPAEYTEPCRWTVSAKVGDAVRMLSNHVEAGQCVGPIKSVALDQTTGAGVPTGQILIQIDRQALGDITDFESVLWKVAFLGKEMILVTPDPKKPEQPGRFPTAKNKEDADIYVSGGFVGAQDSAPIWVLDAKFQVGWPKGRPYHLIGVSGALNVNPEPKPPANASDINPNAMSLYTQMDWGWHVPGEHWLYGVQLVIKPLGGEFAKDPTSGNVTSAGRLNLYSTTYFNNVFTFDPFVGYEVGVNEKKPTKLFDQPVDLSTYDNIARLQYGVTATVLIPQAKPTAELPNRFVLSVSFTGRTLGTKEPYVETGGIETLTGGKRIKTLTLKGGQRNYVEAAFTWNANRYFGIDIKYKQGSLPPLFQHVKPQVSVGLTFKTKLALSDYKPS